jgi:hypothetical protein
MLGVFLVGVSPKEYLHQALFHHHDTVHPKYKKGEIVFTGKHIHCAFLGFVFAPFTATEKQFISFKEIPVHVSNYLLPDYHFSYSTLHKVVSLRGPPVIC